MNEKLSIRKLHKFALFFSFPILAVFLLTFSVNSLAASNENEYIVPYYVSEWDSNFTFSTSTALEVAVDYYYTNMYPNASSVLVYTTDGFLGSGALQYLFIGDPYIDSIISDDFDYSNSFITVKSPYPIFRVGVYADGRMSGTSSQGVYAASLLGNATLVTTVNGDYIPRYPFYYDGEGVLDTNGTSIILAEKPSGPVINQGHATAPNPLNDIDSGNVILPHQVPQLVINNYSWTTTPTPDFSTLEKTAESIYHFLQWLGSNLIGALGNIVSNIVNVGEFIAQTIQYYGGLIFNAIKNGIETFYNNMVSLFEPMLEQIANVGLVFASIIVLGTDPDTGVFSIPYLTQTLLVPDITSVYQLVLNYDDLGFFPFVSAVGFTGKRILTTLSSVTPSHTFHVPSCYYHGIEIGNFDIDFSWFDNYKIYWDTIINGFLIIGYIIWLFVSASSHLRGRMIDGNEPAAETFSYPSGWDGDY